MVTCANCQASNQSTNLYCSRCGTKLNNNPFNGEIKQLSDIVQNLFNESRRTYYPGLSTTSIILSLFGWLLVIIGGAGMVINGSTFLSDLSLSQPGGSFSTALPQTASLIQRLVIISLSVVAFISGISWIANGEMIRLWIDMQANNDKHTIILYGIFRMLFIAQKKETSETKTSSTQ